MPGVRAASGNSIRKDPDMPRCRDQHAGESKMEKAGYFARRPTERIFRPPSDLRSHRERESGGRADVVRPSPWSRPPMTAAARAHRLDSGSSGIGSQARQGSCCHGGPAAGPDARQWSRRYRRSSTAPDAARSQAGSRSKDRHAFAGGGPSPASRVAAMITGQHQHVAGFQQFQGLGQPPVERLEGRSITRHIRAG